MNGECKSYRLNEPMKWQEFKSMPDDIKVTYIKLLREKYNVPDSQLAKMMVINSCSFSQEMKRLGLSIGHGNRGACTKWNKEGFFAWKNGVDKLPTPVPEEEPTEAPIQEPVITSEEPEAYVEDDLPFDIVPVEEPDPVFPKPSELHYVLCAEIDELRKRVDELLKSNEELRKCHQEDKEHISWLRNKLCEIEPERDHLAAQMEVVRMIFGGKNHG